MRKIYIMLIGSIILLTIGLIEYSYFNVSGAEIEGVDEITSTSLVTVTKRSISGNKLNEYVLNEEQIERF